MSQVFVHCPLKNLERQLPYLTEKRLHPEISFQGADLDDLSSGKVAQLARQLKQADLNVTVHGPFHDLNSGALDPAVRTITLARYQQTLEVAKQFSAQLIVFHPGYEHWRYGGIPNLWLQPNLDFWPPLLELAEDYDLVLALENIFEQDPVSLALLLERLDHPRLAHCFDIGHWHLFAKTDLESWFNRMAPHIRHLHLHDNNGDADSHFAIGAGSINFSPLWSAIGRLNLKPTMTLEAHKRVDLEASLQVLPQHLAALDRARSGQQ